MMGVGFLGVGLLAYLEKKGHFILPDRLHGSQIKPPDRAEVRWRTEPQDPRIAQLERLRLALTRAAKRIDEFEMRLDRAIGAEGISTRNLMAGENNFANHVAVCLKKARFADGELRP